MKKLIKEITRRNCSLLLIFYFTKPFQTEPEEINKEINKEGNLRRD